MKRVCVWCGKPLPRGSNAKRQFESVTCRVAAKRYRDSLGDAVATAAAVMIKAVSEGDGHLYRCEQGRAAIAELAGYLSRTDNVLRDHCEGLAAELNLLYGDQLSLLPDG